MVFFVPLTTIPHLPRQEFDIRIAQLITHAPNGAFGRKYLQMLAISPAPRSQALPHPLPPLGNNNLAPAHPAMLDGHIVTTTSASGTPLGRSRGQDVLVLLGSFAEA